jgi:penicillin-binding protein 2
MFGKRKRIPYDPPGARKRNGKRRPPKRSDQIFLTRRMLFLKGTVSTAFLALAGRLGYMQIVQGENFEELATENVRETEQPKAPRGMIFDRVGRILAENYRAWEVKIVPADLPKDPTELKRVKDTLITALRLPEVLAINPNAVPIGSELTVCRRVAELLRVGDPEALIEDIQSEWKRNYLILVHQNLNADLAATFRAAAMELPGVEVMNKIDYLIGNSGDPRLPIVVQPDVSKEIARKLEANSLYLPGVVLDDSALRRRYRGGEVMSHLMGYVGTISEEELNDPEHFTEGGNPIYLRDDIIGKDGIERTMESHLRGKRGYRRVEIDGHGVKIRTVPGTEIPPVKGKNIKLSVDLELQALASLALQEAIRFSNEDRASKPENAGKTFNANSGAVVALDPRNGEVLALVSFPHYDNSLFLDGISQRKYNEYLDESKNQPLLNRASGTSFPPGSTLKLFIGTAALKEKKIDETTTFTCTGAIRVPWTWDESKGTDYKCWVLPLGIQHGTLDIYSAIEQSCDIFFYNAGTPDQTPEDADDKLHYYDLINGDRGEKHYFRGLGIELIHKNLKDVFAFGELTGIDLPWEAPGLVPNQAWLFSNYGQGWSSGDTINVSIGQGYFLASPLQLAVNTAAIANGGKIFRPLLVREFVDDKKERVEKIGADLRRELNVNKKYLDVIREGMRRVVEVYSKPEKGARWKLSNPEGEEEIVIAGKTGTAEFGEQNLEDLTYSHQHAWFTCYAPFDDPEIVITTFIYDGGEGSTYALPVADRVMRAYFEIKKKRERGLILRTDKRPIDAEHPLPNPEAFKFKPVTNS